MHKFILPLTCAALLVAADASAHGGGLNKHGCHHDRKHGGYHCHRGPGTSAPRQQYAPRPRVQPPRLAPQSAPQPSSLLRLSPGMTLRSDGAYRNCTAARAADAAPVRRGESGYGPHLDRDGDGVGCEPWRGR